jgi:hypothetical protein
MDTKILLIYISLTVVAAELLHVDVKPKEDLEYEKMAIGKWYFVKAFGLEHKIEPCKAVTFESHEDLKNLKMKVETMDNKSHNVAIFPVTSKSPGIMEGLYFCELTKKNFTMKV